MDHLPTIFIEALLSNLLPIFNEVTLPAMRAFGTPHLLLANAVSVAGAMVAFLLWFGGGYVLTQRLERLEKFRELQTKRDTLRWWLFLHPTPFGFAFSWLAGAVRVSWIEAGVVVLAAQIFHHAWVSGIFSQ